MRFMRGVFFGLMIAVISLVGYYFLNKQGFNLAFIRQHSAVHGLTHLEVARALEQIEGLQLVSEFVFPYDFITAPYPNWSILALKDPALYSQLDREHRAFFDGVLGCGYDLALRRDEFFLLRVKAGLGYDFMSIEEEATPWLWWSEKSIQSLPEAQVLYFMIDDSLYLQKNFVNSQIDALTWRCLIEYLEPKLYNRMITDDIKEQATRNVALLMNEILVP
jgi:hypothetical protein